MFTFFLESSHLLGMLEKVQLLTVVPNVKKQAFEVEIAGPDNVHVLLGAVP